MRKLRLAHHWNQVELAQKLGMSQSRLSAIEAGKGSISAEQLIILMQTFNVPLSYFVATKSIDPESQLRNAIARLGGSQLKEAPNILPSERLAEINTVIIETLTGGMSSRLITSLVPVVVNYAREIHFDRILKKMSEYKLENRLLWIGDGITRTLDKRLATFVPREQSLKYRKARAILDVFFDVQFAIRRFRGDFSEDLLDAEIASRKTFNQIMESRDDLAKKWHIVTRITEDDFYQSLITAERNA